MAERPPGAWSLSELERLVAEQHAAPAERLDEWRAYLFYLRDFASSDGTLPERFDQLIRDVFPVSTGSARAETTPE
jgi:hypothetical protein